MKKQAMQVFHALYLSRRPAIAFVIVGLFWGCFAAYVPQIKARLDVSDATFGLLLLCNALGLVSSMMSGAAAGPCVGCTRLADWQRCICLELSFAGLGH